MKLPPPVSLPQLETTDVLRPVLLHASSLPGAFVWRENSGLYFARTATGWRRVRASIPGCADIIGMISLSVPRLAEMGVARIGAFLAIEAKTQRGRMRPEQIEFRSAVEACSGIYTVARRAEDVDVAVEGYR